MKAFIAALVAAPLVLAPPASAEMGDFLSHTESQLEFTVNDDTKWAIMTVGLAVCVDLFNGFSPLAEAQKAAEKLDISSSRAARLVELAVKDLCPRAVQGARA